MNKLILCLLPITGFAQSFPGAPGTAGSTAIPKDSSCFTSWATGVEIHRGFLDINDTTVIYDDTNRASFGVSENALGPAEGNAATVVSLGDAGEAILTFAGFIIDGPGFDFAVFENGFQDNYIELAHVAVSSDGIHFFTFPSTSEIPTDQQAWNGSLIDCRYVDNLAGKYRIGFGTPFDLSDIPADPFFDPNAVTHVRITDVVGSIGAGGTDDSHGNRINDPYPTPFASCGFDLDGVGVINYALRLQEQELQWSIWPNPATDKITLQVQYPGTMTIRDLSGKLLQQEPIAGLHTLDVSHLAAGSYLVSLECEGRVTVKQVIIR